MSDKNYQLFGMRIFGEFSGAIAIPVVAFVLLGRWLDGRWGTAPQMMILGFVLAAMISGTVIYRRAKQIGSEYQKMIDSEVSEDSKDSKVSDDDTTRRRN